MGIKDRKGLRVVEGYEGSLKKKLGYYKERLYNNTSRDLSNNKVLFSKKLYSTYLSYLPEKEFGYDLKMNRNINNLDEELKKC